MGIALQSLHGWPVSHRGVVQYFYGDFPVVLPCLLGPQRGLFGTTVPWLPPFFNCIAASVSSLARASQFNRALFQGDDFISTLEDLGELRGLPCTLARFWEVGWLLMTAAALAQAGGFLSLLYPRHLERIVTWA